MPLTEKQLDKIIACALDLLKVGFGSLIAWIFGFFSQRRARRKALLKRLARAKAAVRDTQNVRLYGVHLVQLKSLFDENEEMFDKPVNCDFYDTWLTDHLLLAGQHGESVWDPERCDRLRKAVNKLTL
jgi:hypothetical protein